jgi:hypothetical protein
VTQIKFEIQQDRSNAAHERENLVLRVGEHLAPFRAAPAARQRREPV